MPLPGRAARVTLNAFSFLPALVPYVETGILWRKSVGKLMVKALGIATIAVSGPTATVATTMMAAAVAPHALLHRA
jgi:hypothetical protein